MTAEVAALCRSVADRYAGTLADVVRFAFEIAGELSVEEEGAVVHEHAEHGIARERCRACGTATGEVREASTDEVLGAEIGGADVVVIRTGVSRIRCDQRLADVNRAVRRIKDATACAADSDGAGIDGQISGGCGGVGGGRGA